VSAATPDRKHVAVHLSDRTPHGAVRFIIAAGAVSAVAWMLLLLLSPSPRVLWSAEMVLAAERTRDAGGVVARAAEQAGAMAPPSLDPNRTGMIGPAYSELLTTTGQLEAKRTTTNPDMAGLVLHLLRRAGVEAGDTVAIGASASFPALLVATVIAAETMGAVPVVILSLGSSSYGATNPGFNVLHIYQHVHAAGAVATTPAAVSLGGTADVGADFEPAVRERLLDDIRATRLPLLFEPDRSRNVRHRLQTYFGSQPVTGTGPAAGDTRVAVYVNIGGTDASLGSSPLVLDTRPGLNPSLPPPPPGPERGVMAEMAARGLPIIHLLNIRGLAERYGLPWDPLPMPAPGTTPLREDQSQSPAAAFLLLTAAYFALLAFLAKKARGQAPESRRDPADLARGPEGHGGGGDV
jgi:poly-gamma-glutamate system protein